jgi:hypothetical protein
VLQLFLRLDLVALLDLVVLLDLELMRFRLRWLYR